jgi:hypothetical protein
MPRKKKSSTENNSQAIAEMIFKTVKYGNRDAKREIIAKLIVADQLNFIEHIKTLLGETEYNQVVEVC